MDMGKGERRPVTGPNSRAATELQSSSLSARGCHCTPERHGQSPHLRAPVRVSLESGKRVQGLGLQWAPASTFPPCPQVSWCWTESLVSALTPCFGG